MHIYASFFLLLNKYWYGYTIDFTRPWRVKCLILTTILFHWCHDCHSRYGKHCFSSHWHFEKTRSLYIYIYINTLNSRASQVSQKGRRRYGIEIVSIFKKMRFVYIQLINNLIYILIDDDVVYKSIYWSIHKKERHL